MLKTNYTALALLAMAIFSPAAFAEKDTKAEKAAPVESTQPAPATAQTAVAPEADAKFIDDSSYAVGALMGKNVEGVIASQKNVFTYNQEQVVQGFQDTLRKTGKLTDEELQKQLKALDGYLADKEQKIAAERSKETAMIGEKFRQEFKSQEGVKETASGLLYKITQNPTEGESPKAEDMVKVHYKGTLPDGTVFDSSYERNAPIDFQLNQLIPGWIEAIPMLKKGGKMEIVLPPNLAYGDHEMGKIPANSTLKFDIELLDFTPAAAKVESK